MHVRFRSLAAIAVGLLIPVFGAAAQATAIPAPIAHGLDSLVAGNGRAAVATWGRTWTDEDSVQVANLTKSMLQVESMFGRARGYDLVKLHDVGPSLRWVYVVIRFDKQPLYATFLAYRPNREWQVNSVTWNTDAAEVFPASLLTP